MASDRLWRGSPPVRFRPFFGQTWLSDSIPSSRCASHSASSQLKASQAKLLALAFTEVTSPHQTSSRTGPSTRLKKCHKATPSATKIANHHPSQGSSSSSAFSSLAGPYPNPLAPGAITGKTHGPFHKSRGAHSSVPAPH